MFVSRKEVWMKPKLENRPGLWRIVLLLVAFAFCVGLYMGKSISRNIAIRADPASPPTCESQNRKLAAEREEARKNFDQARRFWVTCEQLHRSDMKLLQPCLKTCPIVIAPPVVTGPGVKLGGFCFEGDIGMPEDGGTFICEADSDASFAYKTRCDEGFYCGHDAPGFSPTCTRRDGKILHCCDSVLFAAPCGASTPPH